MKTRCIEIAALALLLAGCDYVERRATNGERADRLYQVAMEEYAAGRLDKSIGAFERVLDANPANASARFQLATLLQDHRKDPLSAICNYREYMRLAPKGDKAALARARADVCEKQLAEELIRKYNLGGSAAQDEANARLRADGEKLKAELAASKKLLADVQNELSASKRENERVRRMVLAGDADEDEATARKRPDLPDEKSLLDEDAETDRVRLSADVDKLMAEEKDETAERAPFGKTVRNQPPAKDVAPVEPPHEKKPPYYVVQEGDTLFRIAIRFYGRRSAWSAIRDANKAIVSPDGRIRVGQKLRLP